MKRFVAAAVAVAATAALGSPARAGSAPPGDPVEGKHLFHTICILCHTDIKGRNKVGPSLYGVVGRHSGIEPGYNYSEANIKSGIVWTPDVLFKYIEHPQKIVPGTKMGYPGQPDPQKRADIIAYLETLK
ncbi:c-type cytochrome [Rhodopila globiformis]|nr:cytochrome c family protein [Rhodopila globiformis]